MFRVSEEQFNQLVSSAIDNIPKKYGENIKNLAFVVEDEPNGEQRKKLGLGTRQTLFGLYEGVPLTKRNSGYNLVLPDKITIFKSPMESSANNLHELQEQVNKTLWHEVAHYYGLGHANIKELEDKHDNR